MNIYDTLKLFKELCHHATEVNIESLFNTIHHSFNEGYPEILFYRSFYTNGINNEYVYPENMIEVQLIYNVTMYVSLANTHTTKYNQEMTYEDNVLIAEIEYYDGKNSWIICYNKDLRQNKNKKEETDLRSLAKRIENNFKILSY